MARRMMEKLKSKIGIEQKGAKNAPASSPGKEGLLFSAESERCAEVAQCAEKKTPAAQPMKMLGWYPEIYDDTDVCRVLGLRRKELAEVRKTERGECWNVVGMHAGMSAKWIRWKAGVGEEEWPAWSAGKELKRIEPDDGIVTVALLRRHPNSQMVNVWLLANGEFELCKVRDSRMMKLGQQFDCRRVDGRLYLVESLNTERW